MVLRELMKFTTETRRHGGVHHFKSFNKKLSSCQVRKIFVALILRVSVPPWFNNRKENAQLLYLTPMNTVTLRTQK